MLLSVLACKNNHHDYLSDYFECVHFLSTINGQLVVGHIRIIFCSSFLFFFILNTTFCTCNYSLINILRYAIILRSSEVC